MLNRRDSIRLLPDPKNIFVRGILRRFDAKVDRRLGCHSDSLRLSLRQIASLSKL
jgi:hypothetical protein